jgi:hypothetical protein
MSPLKDISTPLSNDQVFPKPSFLSIPIFEGQLCGRNWYSSVPNGKPSFQRKEQQHLQLL